MGDIIGKRRPHSLRMKLTADCASTPVGTALNPEDRQMTAYTDLDDRDKYLPTPMELCRAAIAIEIVERMLAAAKAAKAAKAGAKKARRPARRVA